MGKKSNPISFRLLKNDVPHSQWHTNTNYTAILKDDIMIRKIIKAVYHKNYYSWLNSILIRRTHRGLYIFVYGYGSRPMSVKMDVHSRVISMIRRYTNIYDQEIHMHSYNYFRLLGMEQNKLYIEMTKTFNHYHWIPYHEEYIRLAFVAVHTKNVTAYTNFIGSQIGRKPRHRKLVYVTRQILSEFLPYNNEMIGVRIKFKGRLDGRPRGKFMYLQSGRVALHTISATISYKMTHVFSKYGTFGLRIWACFKKSNVELFNLINMKKHKMNFQNYPSLGTDVIKTKEHGFISFPTMFSPSESAGFAPDFNLRECSFVYREKTYVGFSTDLKKVFEVKQIGNRSGSIKDYAFARIITKEQPEIPPVSHFFWFFLNKYKTRTNKNIDEKVLLGLLSNNNMKVKQSSLFDPIFEQHPDLSTKNRFTQNQLYIVMKEFGKRPEKFKETTRDNEASMADFKEFAGHLEKLNLKKRKKVPAITRFSFILQKAMEHRKKYGPGPKTKTVTRESRPMHDPYAEPERKYNSKRLEEIYENNNHKGRRKSYEPQKFENRFSRKNKQYKPKYKENKFKFDKRAGKKAFKYNKNKNKDSYKSQKWGKEQVQTYKKYHRPFQQQNKKGTQFLNKKDFKPNKQYQNRNQERGRFQAQKQENQFQQRDKKDHKFNRDSRQHNQFRVKDQVQRKTNDLNKNKQKRQSYVNRDQIELAELKNKTEPLTNKEKKRKWYLENKDKIQKKQAQGQSQSTGQPAKPDMIYYQPNKEKK